MKKILPFFLFFFTINTYAQESKIILQYQPRPPYFIVNPITNKLVDGELYNLAQKIMIDSGVPFEFEDLPLTRAEDMMIKKKSRICAPSSFKTPWREKFALFLGPFYTDKKEAIIFRKNDSRFTKQNNISDIIRDTKLVLLVKLGFSQGNYIDDMLKKYKNYSHELKVEVNSPALQYTTLDRAGMLDFIISGKADYMFIPGREGEYLINSIEKYKEHLSLITPTDAPPGENRYFMCSPTIEKETLDKINNSIKKLAPL